MHWALLEALVYEVAVLMDKFSVLIIDDDRELCGKLKAHLDIYPLFDIMEPVQCGARALELIEQQRPDALVLDLILPIYDGMYIIDHIADNMPGYQPVIYVLSILGTKKTNMMLMDCATVRHYSIKPVHPDTVAKNLHRFLCDKPYAEVQVEQSTTHINDEPQSSNYFLPDYFAPGNLRNLDWIIEDYLRKLGIGAATPPTKCAREAISILLKADRNSRVSTMEMYKQTGQAFNPPLSASAVEGNIRRAVDNAKKMRTPLFEQYFPHNGPSVNNTMFVNESANILSRWIAENGNGAVFSQENSALLSKR